jgi:hypothetical protein
MRLLYNDAKDVIEKGDIYFDGTFVANPRFASVYEKLTLLPIATLRRYIVA